MDHYVAHFLLNFQARHGDYVHRDLPENSRRAVIVETRRDFFLPLVVRNVMWFLGPHWNLHWLHGTANEGFLQRSLPGWEFAASRLRSPRIQGDQYNSLLLDTSFWGLFPEEELLVFQTDSIMCSRGIDAYAQFDLIGAPCQDGSIFNGGFSLRRKSKMLAALRDFRGQLDDQVEDIFFSKALRRMGAALPDFDQAARFCVESVYVAHPVGLHGTNKYYLGEDVVLKILRGIDY